MEAPEPTCPAPSAREQPAPVPGRPGAPGGQASPRLTLGPLLLPPEQGLAPTVFLKALPIPLYHTVPPGGLQPRAPLVTAGSLDGGGVPFILSPLLQTEGTVSIVGALPVLSPGPGPALGSPGKVRNAGKYLCPHCGRDCLKPSVLEKHIRSHTGERPFPCTTCRIAFKTQSNLYKHRRTQTHLNNSRLSSESEGAAAGLPEEGDKVAESSRVSMAETAQERPLSPEAQLPLGPAPTDREAPLGSTPVLSPRLPPGSTQLWQQQQPSQDQRPSSLQQPATPSEKPWDPRGSEGRLRKCESTDSGYLSRSDSAEQPPPAASPLHSLSEHSTESEGEGGPGTGTRRPQTESRVPGDSLELEKKRLEERITRLISHNQAVVGDPQLEHVRPRKTVLSKQGSIDLPTPYTYKGSFHFDIRALEPGRRKAALGPARSTLAPLDKSRPLFFHSVPTQLSTTVECIPVTRSNSLPSVEGSRTWPEPADPQGTGAVKQPRPLSPRRAAPARSGYRAGLTLADIPSGHPRALVRQAAVEDLPWTPAGDPLGPEEEAAVRRATPGEATASKGRVAGRRRSGQRRLEMFSQEKWQVYGHETFQRFYQKAKSSCHGGPRAGEGSGGGGTGADLPPPQEEAVGGQQGTARNRETPANMHASGSVKPDESLGSKSPKLGEERAGAGAHGHCRTTRATPPPSPGSKAQPCSASRNPLLPPSMRLEVPPAPGPLQQGELEASRLALPERSQEGSVEDTGPPARSILRWPSSGSGELNLPSERKKPKVEGLGNPEPLVAETPGVPARVASPGSLQQDSGSEKTPEQLHSSVRQVDEALEPPGVSSEESTQHAVAMGPGHQCAMAPQPRTAAHDAFPPKYLLRLPQRKTPPSLSGSQPPWQDQDSLGRSGGPKERASLMGLALTLSSATGPAPGQAGSISWASREPRAYAQRKKEQVGVEWGAGAVSFSPSFVQAAEVGPHTLSHPCPSASTRPSGSYPDLWASSLGLARLPGNALPEPPPGPGLQLTLPCPVKPGTFPTAAGWPELASSPHSGNPRNLRDPSTFPSLRMEPQLTWCCLSRSVPLPVQQEKAASVYLAVHFPGGALCEEGHNPQPVGQEEWTRTRRGEGELALMPKLSHPMLPGVTSHHPASEPEGKKGRPPRRAKAPRRSSKQNKLRINPTRYRGDFLHSLGPLRARRLRRPPWVLTRSCHPPPPRGTDPARTFGQPSSDIAGVSAPGQPYCVTSKQSLRCGEEEKEEDDYRQIPRPCCPSSSSSTLKDLSPSAGERGDCHPPNAAVVPAPSLQADTGLAAAHDLVPHSEGLDLGKPETRLLPSPERVTAGPKPGTSSDTPESSPSGPSGALPCCDTVASGATCVSLGVRAAHTTLARHSVEPQEHSRTSDGKAPAQRQPLDTTEGPLKSIQKEGLEGVRKQTRVQLSDTSSDDEDRLVIEL
ncbi:zinc finger protein 831 [Ochotona princeps]|uniref:zinc finger protein 831 n=1 Tax=Ochotona princeps TaxID=9978 RepID=UPI002714B839|nr:zinc finger protein 831 [Ochotona princeps]